jgi:hypothetical protein
MLVEGVGGNGRTSCALAGVRATAIAPPIKRATNNRFLVRIVGSYPL